MNQSITAEDLYAEMKRMPSSERIRFFALACSTNIACLYLEK